MALSIAALNTANASLSHHLTAASAATPATSGTHMTLQLPVRAATTDARGTEVALLCLGEYSCRARRCILFAMANADDQAGRRALYDWCMSGFRIFY